MANALTLFQKTNNVGVFGKKFIIGDRASLVSSKDNALPASLSKSRDDALTKDFDFISRHLRQKTKHDRSRRVSFAICERRGDPPPARTPPRPHRHQSHHQRIHGLPRPQRRHGRPRHRLRGPPGGIDAPSRRKNATEKNGAWRRGHSIVSAPKSRVPSSMVEQLTLNQLVPGSSPRGATTFCFLQSIPICAQQRLAGVAQR